MVATAGEASSGQRGVAPDPEAHVAAIRQFEDAGFTQLTVHQVGPDQEGFLRFYERETLALMSPPAAGPGWCG